MLLSDLLPLLYQQHAQVPMPLGGPAPPMLAKAPSNATGASIPAVKTPPMSSPTDFMNAATQAQNVAGENKLRDYQTQVLQQQVGLMKNLPASLDQVMSLIAGGPGATSGGGNGTSPSVFGSLAPEPSKTSGAGAVSDPRGVEPVIRAAAEKYGIDPDVALKVAKSEGLGTFYGDGGKSGGAFQLYTGGGMGNDFIKDTGLDPLDPKNEAATIDYAMRRASEEGWGAWHGARKIGITGFMGIGGAKGDRPGLPSAPDFSGRFAGNEGQPYAPLSLAGPPQSAASSSPPGGPGNVAQYARPGDKGGPVTVEGVTYPSVSAWNRAMDARAEAAGPTMDGRYGSGAGSQPIRIAQNGPMAPGSLAPPSPPPAAPQPAATAPQMAQGGAFGSLAPAMLGNPNPAMSPLQRAIVQFGVLSRMAKLGDVATPLEQAFYNSPQYKAAQAAASMAATKPIELQFARPLAAETAAGGAPFKSPVYEALAGAQQFPAGSPERQALETAARNSAGIKPFLGGERPGVPGRVYNPQTGAYDIAFQNPALPQGTIPTQGPNGGVVASAVPGALPLIRDVATAHAAGPASFEPQPYIGAGNTPMTTSRAQAFAPGAPPLQTGLPANEQARLTAQGQNEANLGPLLQPQTQQALNAPLPTPAAPSQAMPGQEKGDQQPATKTEAPTESRYGLIPPLSEQKLPATADELKSAIPQWSSRVQDWTKAIDPARQAEQRLMTIAQAFKATESGSFAQEKGAIAAALKSVGINLPAESFGSPAALQLALHENILTTLPLLKAATPRPTQTEFVTTSENREHPNIQPEANLQMLAEDIAMMRQAQNLPSAYNASKWSNPFSFETAYFNHNKLEPMVQQIRNEIGPLKGMAAAPPQAAVDYLRANPGARSQFDAKYGAGSAERVLGK